MGLDTVELVMAFEEAFGIEIPNAAAERMRTPRDVVEYVCTAVPLAPSGACATHRAFCRVRRALRGVLPDARLRPGTRLCDVTTREAWPGVWAQARAEDGGADWPGVHWHRWPRGGPATVRSLAFRLVPPVAPPDAARGERWTRERIGARVREVVRDELGLDDFAMRDEFVRDMGID